MSKSSKFQKEMKLFIKEAKRLLVKAKKNAKSTKPVTRLILPSNKRHKTKKDYKRNNKVKQHEVEKD